MTIKGRGCRVKGFQYERDLVNKFKEAGLDAKRAYGSNGESAGKHSEVDVWIENEQLPLTFQAKRTKKIAKMYTLDNVDGVIFREDRGEDKILIPLELFIKLVDKYVET